MKKIFLFFSLVLVLTGCTKSLNEIPDLVVNGATDVIEGDIFSNRDLRTEIDLSEAYYITLSESIEITKEGIYVLDGTIDNGQITINTSKDEKVQLILNNVNITNETCAAINVIQADKVFITSEVNSINNLVSKKFTDDSIDGVIYSKDDITFNGYGTLNIESNEHGIVGKDDVVLAHSTFNINSKKRGIDANDSIRIYNGNYNITSGKDAIKADEDAEDKGFIYINDGEFNIDSVEDGFASSGFLEIIDGKFDIVTGGGFDEVLNDLTVGEGSGGVIQPTDLLEYSMQCFRNGNLIIHEGEFNLSSYEDTIHSNGNIVINGGKFEIISGDDAIHADDQILITDGDINVVNCYEGIEADFITITGGKIVIIGYDDGINVSEDFGVLTITGGNIYVSTKGDCIDSNGDFIMTGGYVMLKSEAIYTMGDYAVDVNGTISITGGSLVDEDGNDIDYSSKPSTGNRPR